MPPGLRQGISAVQAASGNRHVRLKLSKGACTLVSVEEPYKGERLVEDQASLRSAISKAVKRLIGQWIGVHSKAEVTELSQAEKKKRELDVSLAPPDPKLGYGHLYVATNPPGATIMLNKQLTEFKTPHLFEDLAVGSYAVKVESGEAVGGKVVGVKPNEAVRVVIEMKSEIAKQGSLMVETEPALLRVYVDGVFRGRAPLFVPAISAGAHEISASGWGDGTIWRTETREVTVQAGIRNRYTLRAYDAIQERRERVSFEGRLSGGLEFRKAKEGVAGLVQLGIGTGKWVDIFSGVGFPGYVWVTDCDINLYPKGRFVPTLTTRVVLGFDKTHQYYGIEELAGLETWILDWMALYAQVGVGYGWNLTPEPNVGALIVPGWLGLEFRY